MLAILALPLAEPMNMGPTVVAGSPPPKQDGDQTNFYPPAVHHPFHCAVTGIWTGSCSIDYTQTGVGVS